MNSESPARAGKIGWRLLPRWMTWWAPAVSRQGQDRGRAMVAAKWNLTPIMQVGGMPNCSIKACRWRAAAWFALTCAFGNDEFVLHAVLPADQPR